METAAMIQNLRALAEKHKNDRVYTFETRWTDVCRDVANRLEEQEQKIAELTKTVNELSDHDTLLKNEVIT